MNYRYLASGIPVASATGSSTLLTCTADSQCGVDGGMCRGGHCFRLDYSRQTLPTGGNTPGALVENNLNGPAWAPGRRTCSSTRTGGADRR
jgi:hypothetical protein